MFAPPERREGAFILLLLHGVCGCGSGLKREIQIPCIALEAFRTGVRCSKQPGSGQSWSGRITAGPLVSTNALCNVMVFLLWVLLL